MKNNPYSIQDFVVRTLESFGALTEQKEYALVEVLMTDMLAQNFNGKNMLLLAFDFEVAKEHELSEFVTFGSYILDEVIRLALSKGQMMKSFIPVERLEVPPKIEDMIRETIHFEKCRPPRVKNHYIARHCYYRFNFHCTYEYDEKQESIVPVLVHMNTGRQDDDVQRLMHDIDRNLPNDGCLQIIPVLPEITGENGYILACEAAKPIIAREIDKIRETVTPFLNQEMKKVTTFYESTLKDLSQRLLRSNDKARIERIKKQIEATKADKKRRILDVMEKHSVRAAVSLDSVVAYYFPNLHLNLEIQQKDEFFEFEIVFNCLSRKVEIPLCPECGRPAGGLRRDGGVVHCGCAGE